MRRPIRFLWLFLMFTTLACVLLATEEPTTTPTEEEANTAGAPTSTDTSDPAMTQTPTATTEGDETRNGDTPTSTPAGCTLGASFIEDVTIPDDTALEPGADFRKTWRLRNSGSCNWEAGTRLVFVSGETLNGPDSVIVPAAAAGSTAEVSVELTAPTTPGTYRSEWRLQAPDGTRFGTTIYVQIIVPEPPTVTPTPTDTPAPITATPTPTSTPDETGCTTPYDPAFTATMDYAADLGFDIGCAESFGYDMSGAVQIFWANVDEPNPHLHYRTLMIWNKPYKQGEIYYVTVSETTPVQPFHASYDTWEEEMPEVPPDCADMPVPDGYLIPIRGFSKLWCEQELWTTIGWPSESEVAITFRVQQTEHGRLMRFGDPLINTYVVAWDYDTNEALVHMNPIEP